MADILASGRYPVAIRLRRCEDEARLPAIAATLIAELRVMLRDFAEPQQAAVQTVKEHPGKASSHGFFLPDAFSNPEHFRYALKTTLAALFCYVLYSLLDWPGIHTCFITCYIVALSTTAESVEKLTLRILGCLGGAAAGIATLVFVMPALSSIGGLLTVVFLGAFGAAWIAGGGPRVGYAGFQVAFAFFLSVIQGPAPAFDMVVARDRVIGILLGIVVSYAVSAYLWPVSVARRIDPAIVSMLQRLSACAAAPSPSMRRDIGVVALAGVRSVGQDLGLLSYEPRGLRPSVVWMQRRTRILERIAALTGPLLLTASSHAALGTRAAHRLSLLANQFSQRAVGEPDRVVGFLTDSSAPALWEFVGAPLVALEMAIADDGGSKDDEHAPG